MHAAREATADTRGVQVHRDTPEPQRRLASDTDLGHTMVCHDDSLTAAAAAAPRRGHITARNAHECTPTRGVSRHVGALAPTPMACRTTLWPDDTETGRVVSSRCRAARWNERLVHCRLLGSFLGAAQSRMLLASLSARRCCTSHRWGVVLNGLSFARISWPGYYRVQSLRVLHIPSL
jgi:hypothetical protein